MFAQDGVIGTIALHNGLDQRHQCGFQFGEDRLDVGHGHAPVRAVDERIGDVGVAREELCIAAAQIQRLFQIGLDRGEIVGRARLGPDHICLAGVGRQFGHEGTGDARGAVEVVVRHVDDGAHIIVGRQLIGIGREFVEQPAQRRAGLLFVDGGGHGGQLTAASVAGLGRQIRGLIPVEQRFDPAQIGDLGQQRAQFL